MTSWHDYLKKNGHAPAWPYPIKYEQEQEVAVDVVIVGGGIAGCWAAIAAAREGVKVALVEKGDTVRSGLGINMHTVRRAYLELRDQGIITMRLGRRARINENRRISSTDSVRDAIETRLRELVTDALLAGLTEDEFKNMVSKQFER